MSNQNLRRYGSDVMVDAMKSFGFRYAAMNPGATFRGLHDSIVNYGENNPELIECPHEKIAVTLAHGYAKACGEPMAVILHNVVGLLHGTLGIYYAYIDRVPVMVFGGAGPMPYEKRRPNIDWIHTANLQGNVVRDFTKWDEQPASIASVHEAVARGFSVAMSEPRGPVYIALDAGLQEDALEDEIVPLDVRRYPVPTRIGPDMEALRTLAEALVSAESPVMITGYAGRDPAAFQQLVELADLLSIGVVDTHWRLNFPNKHPLNVTDSHRAISEADVVLFVDVKDMGKSTMKLDKSTRRATSLIRSDATILDLGFNNIGISSWLHDFGQLHPTDIQVTADTVIALPQLLQLCQEIEAKEDESRRSRRRRRREWLSGLHESIMREAAEEEARQRDFSPVSTSRLVRDTWEVVRNYDWVLTAGTVKDWAFKIWDFDEPYRHPGRDLGTATQISMSLGVALAHKGSGKLVVDLQPDGDLMFDPGALWVASYYKIPMLVVMYNNRAYYNDWDHQIIVAHTRGTDERRAYLGMEIDNPAPDFASIAQSFGWYAEGPISDPNAVQSAVRRAAEHVIASGLPALVDVVCQQR